MAWRVMRGHTEGANQPSRQMTDFGFSYPAGAANDPAAPYNDDDDKLDAYGHLTWCVGTDEEELGEEDGEWMACFDAIYNPVTNEIEYEVVVDGGSFIDTIESGSYLACDDSAIQGLKDLPAYWNDIGLEQGMKMSFRYLTETMESWAKHIDDLASRAISKDDMEALADALGEQERMEQECRP
jgi:hypothetical protein